MQPGQAHFELEIQLWVQGFLGLSKTKAQAGPKLRLVMVTLTAGLLEQP